MIESENICSQAPARGLASAEFEQRLVRTQRTMAANGLDLLLLTTAAELHYFSGFQTPFWQSPTRPWFLLIPQAALPVAVIPSIGEVCMRRTPIQDIRTWPSPQPEDDGISLLIDTVQELIGHQGCLGIAMSPGTQVRMPLKDLDWLRQGLAGLSWRDSTRLVDVIRADKSSAEISKIRYVCEAVSCAFQELSAWLQPGMSDVDVFRSFRISCLEQGVDDVRYLVGAAGPGGYDDIISPPTGRMLQCGDVLMLDTGCVFDGYFCDFDRNFAIGSADRAAAKAYRITWEAIEAGLAMARPGVVCSELFGAMQAVMAPHAVDNGGAVGRLGHGLGLQLTEPPSLMSGDHTELRPNMVITLEPGFSYAPGKMMVLEENVLITASGCELLNLRAPEQLPVIDWL